jgi:hypothetical protein
MVINFVYFMRFTNDFILLIFDFIVNIIIIIMEVIAYMYYPLVIKHNFIIKYYS